MIDPLTSERTVLIKYCGISGPDDLSLSGIQVSKNNEYVFVNGSYRDDREEQEVNNIYVESIGGKGYELLSSGFGCYDFLITNHNAFLQKFPQLRHNAKNNM